MQPADTVGPTSQPQTHHRHVEDCRVPTVVVLSAQRQHVADGGSSPVAGATELHLYEPTREAVDAGGHRGVRGEDRPGAGLLERCGERQTVGGHELGDALDAKKARVPLVGVVDLRRGRSGDAAERPKRPNPTDAEQQLLEESVVGAAAVQSVGDLAQRGWVLLDVGVHQQQRHPTDLGEPQRGEQLLAPGYGEGDPGRRPVVLS